MTQLQVHPIAALFPMLSADELKALAADIKERGQLQPVVLDSEGRVIDGRNRLAACELAGVEPQFTTYNGDDVDGYALAVNIARRHLTTGARAVIAAKAARLNGYGSATKIATFADLQNSRISEASIVLDHLPDLADAVIADTEKLTVAVEKARAVKREAEERQSKKATLRRLAPDLADLVDEERMTLDDAMAALSAREEKAQQKIAIDERAAKLPADLAERVRAGLSIDEAEKINKERESRLDAWAEKIDQALTVLGRMIGHPIPDGLDTRLTETRYKALTDILNRTEGVHVDNL